VLLSITCASQDRRACKRESLFVLKTRTTIRLPRVLMPNATLSSGGNIGRSVYLRDVGVYLFLFTKCLSCYIDTSRFIDSDWTIVKHRGATLRIIDARSTDARLFEVPSSAIWAIQYSVPLNRFLTRHNEETNEGDYIAASPSRHRLFHSQKRK